MDWTEWMGKKKPSARLRKYELVKEHAEHFLGLFHEAEMSNWQSKPVARLLADLFSQAKSRKWFAGISEDPIDKTLLETKNPFWNKELVGRSILLHVANLCDDTWSLKNGWAFDVFQSLDIGEWENPELEPSRDKLPKQKVRLGSFEIGEASSDLKSDLAKINPADQVTSRSFWNQLAKDVDYLKTESSMTAFESEEYATAIFRFNKIMFRDQLRWSSRCDINHSNLCSLVLAPLYFSAIFDMKSIFQIRIKVKTDKDWVGNKVKVRVPVGNPLDYCKHCGKVLSLRLRRPDLEFCDNGCRTDHHNARKKKKP